MPNQRAEDKQRFALNLTEDLLEELRAEAQDKQTSVTQLIERALRNRHNNDLSTEEYQAKAMRLCPKCTAVFRAYSHSKPLEFTTKILRSYLWEKLGFWEHGKFDQGCPDWQEVANPEELRKIQDELAQEILNASVS